MKITDEMKQAGIAALRNAEATHEAAKLPDGPLGRYVPWIEHAAVSVIEAALSLSAQPGTEAEAGEPVQDTWFTDSALPVMAMSGDTEDSRVLKLHFRRPVTDDDRKAMTDALNLHQKSLAYRVQELEKALEQIRDVDFADAKELQYLNAKATIIERLSAIADAALTAKEA
jgi:hypothetical protein